RHDESRVRVQDSSINIKTSQRRQVRRSIIRETPMPTTFPTASRHWLGAHVPTRQLGLQRRPAEHLHPAPVIMSPRLGCDNLVDGATAPAVRHTAFRLR